MTEFAGLDLRAVGGTPALGASFVLRSPSPETRCVSLGDWTIDVVKGSKAVLTRGVGAGGYHDAVYKGLDAANQGLDLICAMTADRHLIEKAADEHLAWWTEPSTGSLTVAAFAEEVSYVRGGAVGGCPASC